MAGTTKKSILQEALADSKALKEAAFANAKNVLFENLKDNLREMVDESINEMAEEGSDESAPDAEFDLSNLEGGDSEGEDEMATEDELNLSEAEEVEDEDDSSEYEEDDGGLSEADLSAAVAAALNEVDHGALGDMEEIDPDSHPTGLMDQDSKEAGWEEKTAPAKKDFTMKESVDGYKKRIAKLVTENTMLKKANQQLKNVVAEVNLFNTKLHYAHKLINREGLEPKAKKQIVAKFDEVRTTAEAKRLYESLDLALRTVSGSKPVAKKPGRQLSEALGITSTGSERANLTESAGSMDDPFSPERMKIVAGITKQ